jgi:carboxypeptidase C (cathepsin A)
MNETPRCLAHEAHSAGAQCATSPGFRRRSFPLVREPHVCIWTSIMAICLYISGGKSAIAEDHRYAPVIHSVSLGGGTFSYIASIDEIMIDDAGGAPGAKMAVLSYVRQSGTNGDIDEGARRPIVFAFNGGPGSSSIFLHVGLLGPKRLDVSPDILATVDSTSSLVPNPDTLLRVADIVLVDPVGTGFSRITNDNDAAYFRSVSGDAASVAQAIEKWTIGHHRQDSPIFLMGESYGAVRAVEASRDLNDTAAATVHLRGVILLSQSLGIVDTVQRRSNIVGQAVGLPTLAATAWFHERAGATETLEAFVHRAEAFATDVYLPALFAGSAITPQQRDAAAKELSNFTGLPAAYFVKHELFLTKEDFRRLLLADKGLILGLYDTRYTGPLSKDGDPSARLNDAFVSATGKVLRDEFGVDDSSDYRPMEPSPTQHWTYIERPFEPTNGDDYSQIDYARDLSELMAKDTQLRVLVAGGYFDTAASTGADDYLLAHNGLDLTRITARHYIGGHLFYSVPASRMQLSNELKHFVSVH